MGTLPCTGQIALLKMEYNYGGRAGSRGAGEVTQCLDFSFVPFLIPGFAGTLSNIPANNTSREKGSTQAPYKGCRAPKGERGNLAFCLFIALISCLVTRQSL